MYGDDEAAVYDAIYRGMGKDYGVEAFAVVVEVLQRKPDATTLLDVACGTGGHLAAFAPRFTVEGVEPSQPMADAARRRLPGVTIHEADMRTLDLGRRFDAVTCLFSAIGYMRSPAELDAAVAAMAGHLHPGGVLVVEPWVFPDVWEEGLVSTHRVDTEDGTIVRMNSNRLVGRTARMDLHYLVGSYGSVRHFAETHELTLFRRDEYEAAVTAAGLTVEFQEPGLTGRGLFLGTAP